MSKRKGDVQVLDYAVSHTIRFRWERAQAYQKRGWEPNAILNWLALAGWGVQHDTLCPAPSSGGVSKQAPDSTTVMSVKEMIRDVSLLSSRIARRLFMFTLHCAF